jgi:hypothetical protein
MACHGIIGSNVVTDFGYGSSNFLTNQNFFNSNRTAFNDTDVNHAIGGWQSLTVSGTVYIPQALIPASESNVMFGLNADTTLLDVLQLTNPPGSKLSMVNGVTPAPGQAPVIADSSITITYPSANEISALLPSSLQNQPVAFAPINVPGINAPRVSGLGVDASGNFVRNVASTVQCFGDVAINGPVFLNNLNLQTDSNGCRLYVNGTVFIQGPINYAALGNNLQISSSRAIIMGMSATRMGANPVAGSTIRTNDSVLTTAGGPLATISAVSGCDVQSKR